MVSSMPCSSSNLNGEQGVNSSNSEVSSRSSTRQRVPPRWMDDFMINSTNISASHIIHNAAYTPRTFLYMISPALKPAYVNFLTNLSSAREPWSYEQSKIDSNWVQAMDQELEALECNKPWDCHRFTTRETCYW